MLASCVSYAAYVTCLSLGLRRARFLWVVAVGSVSCCFEEGSFEFHPYLHNNAMPQ